MRDLFGQIPVLLSEIEAWLSIVPRLPYNHRARRGAYVKDWRVVEKIQQAKLSGRLPAILGECLCEFCGQDLQPEPGPVPISPQIELDALRRRVAVLEMAIQAQAAVAAMPTLPEPLARRVKSK